MPVITKRCCFLHTPKTGGTWVTAALLAAVSTAKVVGETHVTMKDARSMGLLKNKYTFAFVRNPHEWLASRWCDRGFTRYIHKRRLIDPLFPVSQEEADVFSVWVKGEYSRCPSLVSQRFKAFIGEEGSEVDYIGRYEHLADDLIAALILAGEEFDLKEIRTMTPRNKAPAGCKAVATYDNEAWNLVLQQERGFLNRFYKAPIHLL